jgi:hypothetical protein
LPEVLYPRRLGWTGKFALLLSDTHHFQPESL